MAFEKANGYPLKMEHDEKIDNATSLKRQKLVYTFALVLLWTVVGFFNALITVCLPDLRDRVGTTTEAVSVAVGCKGIGYMFGGLISGVLHDKFHTRSSLFLAVGVTVAGASTMVAPWTGYVEILGIAIFSEGFAQGSLDAVATSLVTKIWGKSADPALHLCHFGSAIGALFSPIVASPFLSTGASSFGCDSANFSMTSPCFDDVNASSYLGEHSNSRVEIPYFIAGGLSISTSLFFWILLAFGQPKKILQSSNEPKKSWKNVFNPASCADGRSCFGIVMVVLFIMWAICSQALIGTYNFNFTYATESELGLTKKEGAWFDFIVKSARVIGRLAGVILSRYIPIQILMLAELSIMVVSSSLTAFIGVTDKIMFYISCALTHMMFAPAWSGIFGFVDKYIKLMSFVVALSMIGSGLSILGCTWLIGFLFDQVSKRSIFYLAAAAAAVMLVLQVTMQVIGSINGVRELNQKDIPEKEMSLLQNNGAPVTTISQDDYLQQVSDKAESNHSVDQLKTAISIDVDDRSNERLA